jgi:cell growth-regulating nucleolar protein
VSEHEKYALGATKPGGYAAQGFFHEGQAQQAAAAAVATAAAATDEAVGLEFLSQRPPWRCACCNVSCTSRETLMGHAAGAKHKRRVSRSL